MIVPLDNSWIYDDDLARLLDDGCPHVQDEEGRVECMECGGTHLSIHQEEHAVHYNCPDCGLDDWDSVVDLYGVMAAPYGHLL